MTSEKILEMLHDEKIEELEKILQLLMHRNTRLAAIRSC